MNAILYILMLSFPFLICGAGVLMWGKKGAWIMMWGMVAVFASTPLWLVGATFGGVPKGMRIDLAGAAWVGAYLVGSAFLAAKYVK